MFSTERDTVEHLRMVNRSPPERRHAVSGAGPSMMSHVLAMKW
jgi:hypothetical protein